MHQNERVVNHKLWHELVYSSGVRAVIPDLPHGGLDSLAGVVEVDRVTLDAHEAFAREDPAADSRLHAVHR